LDVQKQKIGPATANLLDCFPSVARRASQFYSSLLLQQVEQTAARRQFVVSGELTIARKEIATAHNRLNDYLSRGIVPDDLAKNGRHLGG